MGYRSTSDPLKISFHILSNCSTNTGTFCRRQIATNFSLLLHCSPTICSWRPWEFVVSSFIYHYHRRHHHYHNYLYLDLIYLCYCLHQSVLCSIKYANITFYPTLQRRSETPYLILYFCITTVIYGVANTAYCHCFCCLWRAARIV